MNIKITGTELIQVIPTLLREQSLSAQTKRQLATNLLISKFAQRYEIPPQTGAISAIAKALRQNDEKALEIVWGLSESLRRLDRAEILELLASLKKETHDIQTKAHQAKTRAAFVNAFLRPFSNKYTNSWFAERTDIDVSEAKMMIEYLERKTITDAGDLEKWADDVVELFLEIVVFIDRDPDARFTRPFGTVSEKSARTYLQSWGTFIEEEADKILRLAIDVREGSSPRNNNGNLSLSKDGQISAGLTKPSFSTKKIAARPPIVSKFAKLDAFPETQIAHSLTIEVTVTSNINGAATAKRKWLNKEDFTSSITDWIATFPILWSDAADDLKATIRLHQTTGESEMSLPKLSLASAAEKIRQAAELQI